MAVINYYDLFHRFMREYKACGYAGIDRQDALIREMETLTRPAKQFFYVADILQVKIKFASSGTREIFGIEPDELDPSTFYTSTHPNELVRHNLARTKLFKMGQELFISKGDPTFISVQFTMRHADGTYKVLLVQCYLYYSWEPYETVFLFQVTTDISQFRIPRHGYHFYVGNDLKYFRYPDNELLAVGHVFTDREFDILKLISQGLDSQQIAKQLFLSTHTVNKHRQNILSKTESPSTHELVIVLKEQGVL